MGSGSSLILTFTVERRGARYRVKASGPLGTAEHEVPPEATAGLARGTSKDAATREHGRLLYDALLAGHVRACLVQHRARAQQEGSLLRLVFRLPQDPDASGWPIESLYEAAAGEDLALVSGMTLTRDDPQWRPPRIVAIQGPVSILVVIPEPVDLQPFGAQTLWDALESAMHPLTSKGQARIARAPSATERALEETLRAEPWHVLHFVGQGSSRPAARYGTLSFEGGDRRTRAVSAQTVARLCEKCPSLGLAVLQAIHHTPARQAFEVVTHAVLDGGLMGVVWLPDFAQPQVSAAFARELYGALAFGQVLDEAVASARRALASVTHGAVAGAPRSGIDLGYWSGPVLFAGERGAGFGMAGPAAPVAASTQAAAQTPAGPAARLEAPQAASISDTQQAVGATSRAQLETERRRAAGEFDVFLCHSNVDKAAVKEIGLKLMERGILPWLDEWELRPGIPWQRLLEEQITGIKAAAVFVGREGIGPWQRQELDGFLREFVQRRCPVIPVLLPGAPVQPHLPLFLEGMTWVDFRVADPDPMARLIWGITGRRPEIT